MLRGCFGCGDTAVIGATDDDQKEQVITKEEPSITTTKEEIEVEPAKEEIKAEPKKPFGPDAAALGLSSTSASGKLADYLANPDSKFPFKIAMDHMYFNQADAAKMDDAGKREINELAKVLKAYPNLRANLFGHIDANETDIYNGKYQDGSGISTSRIRARCAYRRLIKAGVDRSALIDYIGKGKSDPLNDNSTDKKRRANRRVEIEITRR